MQLTNTYVNLRIEESNSSCNDDKALKDGQCDKQILLTNVILLRMTMAIEKSFEKTNYSSPVVHIS